MESKIILAFLVLFTIQYVGVEAARKVNVKKRFSEGMARYSTWRQRRDTGSDEPPPDMDDLLGLEQGEHLQDVAKVSTSTGSLKEKLTETYEGLPVFGQSVVIETVDGEPTGSISGHLIEGISEDVPSTDPSLSADEALELAAESMGHSTDDIEPGSIHTTLEVYVEDQESTEEALSFLAYSISYMISVEGKLTRPSFLMNANTGEIVRQWEGLTSHEKRMARYRRADDFQIEGTGPYEFETVGGNLKMGRNTYGSRFPALNIWMEDGECFLTNDKVDVIDASSGGGNYEPFSFGCEQGFNDSVNGAYSPMADAFFYGTMTYDLFMEWVGVEPLNFKIQLVVHEGWSMENAFWDGSRTYFGDGRTTFYPLTVLDVVAHEVAHGFTEQNSGLIYSGQSGGMNEAFSDIAGVAAEEYMKSVDEWMLGEDAFKAENQALRYMIEPTDDGVSISHMQQYCGNIDVHYSSGLYNKAFYLLSTTEGWNVRMAFQAFAVANELYWTPDSTFRAGACGVVQAAADLGFNQQDVAAAFAGVGIPSCLGGVLSGLDLISDLHAIENETLTFTFVLDEENLDELRFETYASDWYGIQWNLHVETPRRTLSAFAPDDVIIVNLPEPGTYTVSMEAIYGFQMADLYAIKGQVVLAENMEFDSTGIYNGSFSLPQDVIDSGDPVALRTGYPNTESDDYAKYFVVTHEGTADAHNRQGDIMPCARSNNKKNIYEAFLRDPEPGQYNFQIVGSTYSYYYYYSPSSEGVDGLQFVMEKLLLPEAPQ